MALHDIREVRIPIELDKPRTLLFDLNAFAELEDKFGSLDQAFQKMQQGSVKATRTLLWAGLRQNYRCLTVWDAGELITEHLQRGGTLEEVIELCADSLRASGLLDD